MLFFVCFVASDVSLKLYSGGSHDGQGGGWLLITTIVGLAVALPIILLWLKGSPSTGTTTKIIAVLLLITLIVLHFRTTANLGQGRSYWYEWNGLY
jgi:hypothetical protein